MTRDADPGHPRPPRVTNASFAKEPASASLHASLREAVRGGVWFDRATRAVYATDASNYRQIPIGVVCPKDAADIVSAMRLCAAHNVPVTPRGAGTSLAGQAVTVGIVLDTSRHMRQILEIDPERRIARVEPGGWCSTTFAGPPRPIGSRSGRTLRPMPGARSAG